MREITPRTALTQENWDAILREAAAAPSPVSLDLSACECADDDAPILYRGAFRCRAGENEEAAKKIAALVLPDAAVKIENAKLYTFSALKTVRGKNIREIAQKAFKLCSALETVDFPNAERIGSSAFEMCFSLRRALFPRLQKIGSNAFERCWALESLVLGQKIPALGANSFQDTRHFRSALAISVPCAAFNSFLAAWGHADEASECALFGENHKMITIESRVE